MTDKPQYTVTLLPGNEVPFLSLSRKAKVKPEYRSMGAVDHYQESGRILLHNEVRAILLKRKRERVTKERKHDIRDAGRAPQEDEIHSLHRSKQSPSNAGISIP